MDYLKTSSAADRGPHRFTWIFPVLVGLIGVVGSSGLTLLGGESVIENAVTLVFPVGWDRADVFLAVTKLNVDILEVSPRGLLAVVVPRDDVATDALLATGALFSMGAIGTAICVRLIS